MKQLLILTSLVMCITACGPSKEEIEAWEKRKKDSINAITQQALLLQNLDNPTNETAQVKPTKSYNPNSDFYIGIYSINGCEYISFGQGKGCCAVVHAGNCCNPIHHKNHETSSNPDFPIN